MSKGFDHYYLNQELALSLLLEEATGTTTRGWEKAAHLFTLNGVPTWVSLANGLGMLNFVLGNPDYIECTAGASADLNFIAGDFSGIGWIYTTATGNRYLFNKGTGTTGWAFYLNPQAEMDFYTAQAGPIVQSTEGSPLALNTWHCVGFSRTGAIAKVYTNGVDVTSSPDAHVNPDSAAATAFTVGSTAGGAAGWWDGRIWGLRVWSKLMPPATFKTIFEIERHLFGV